MQHCAPVFAFQLGLGASFGWSTASFQEGRVELLVEVLPGLAGQLPESGPGLGPGQEADRGLDVPAEVVDVQQERDVLDAIQAVAKTGLEPGLALG